MSWWCCNTASSSTADCFSSDTRPLQEHKEKQIGVCTFLWVDLPVFPPDSTILTRQQEHVNQIVIIFRFLPTGTSPKQQCVCDLKVIGRAVPKAPSIRMRNFDLLPLPYVQLFRIWKTSKICVLAYYKIPCNHRLKKQVLCEGFSDVQRFNPTWPSMPGNMDFKCLPAFHREKRTHKITRLVEREKKTDESYPWGHGLSPCVLFHGVLFQDTLDWPSSSHCNSSYGNHKLIPTGSLAE